MNFPCSSTDITRHANRRGLYNFSLTKDRNSVCIHTVTNSMQTKQTLVHGHYYTHSLNQWLDYISTAINGNTSTPNIT